MTYNLTDEIKAKLSPEQLVIVEKWQMERTERSKIMDRVKAQEITLDEALELMVIPDECEHGRHIMCACIACDEIENIINPNRVKGEEDAEVE